MLRLKNENELAKLGLRLDATDPTKVVRLDSPTATIPSTMSASATNDGAPLPASEPNTKTEVPVPAEADPPRSAESFARETLSGALGNVSTDNPLDDSLVENADPQKVPVAPFPPDTVAEAPVAQGPEDGALLAQHAVQINRQINETGASLSQLYRELGVTLLRLQAMPKYGAHGRWEGWLKRWGVSQKRWHKAKTLADGYTDGEQLAQLPVKKACDQAAAKRRAKRARKLVAPLPSTGEIYVPAAGIDLRCCDFREWDVPPLTIDAIVTDPPWARGWVENLPALAEFCARVLREDGVAVFFYGAQCVPEFIEAMKGHLTYQWQMFSVYLRPGLLQRSVQFISKYQMAMVYSKSLFNLRQPIEDVMPDGAKNKDLHPWARNLLPVQYCVESFSEPGDLVCDPLGGSFTTAEACHRANRRCIACDIDPACLEMAKKRFNGVNADLYDELAEETAADATDDAGPDGSAMAGGQSSDDGESE